MVHIIPLHIAVLLICSADVYGTHIINLLVCWLAQLLVSYRLWTIVVQSLIVMRRDLDDVCLVGLPYMRGADYFG